MRFVHLKKDRVEPSHFDVHHGAEQFRVMIKRRPQARRMILRVSGATGEIVLTLPERASLTTAQKFAEAHGGWIATRMQCLPEPIAFVPGAVIPVRGVPHRIVRRETARMPSGLLEDIEGERIIAVGGEEAHVPRRVREILTREASRDLKEAVLRYTDRLGVVARRITLRDTTSRWGSCSSRGGLSFSWRLILAPAEVLDYLAAHEVAHLVEMNHSYRFWRIVHDICPHTDAAEKWLKHNGSSLHRYG